MFQPIQSFFSQSELSEHLLDLRGSIILTSITGITALFFSNPIINCSFAASTSFFTTRVVKKLIKEYNVVDYIEGLALIAMRDYPYIHILVILVSIVFLWYLLIVSVISSALCGIYCGLTIEVHTAHELQSILKIAVH